MFERLRNLDCEIMAARTRAYVAKEEFFADLFDKESTSGEDKKKKDKDGKGKATEAEEVVDGTAKTLAIIRGVMEEDAKRKPSIFSKLGDIYKDNLDDEDDDDEVDEDEVDDDDEVDEDETEEVAPTQAPSSPDVPKEEPKAQGPDFSALQQGVTFERPDVQGGTPVTSVDEALAKAASKGNKK